MDPSNKSGPSSGTLTDRTPLSAEADTASNDKSHPVDLPISILLPAVKHLREATGLPEAMYRRGPRSCSSRAFVQSSILDEIEKAAETAMRLKSFLSGGSDPSSQETAIWRTTHEMTLEEQRLRVRRLCEAFVTAVLFTGTNEDVYYDHYLLLSELEGALNHRRDRERFHAKPSAWLNTSISLTVRQLQRCEQRVDQSRAWYRNPNIPMPVSEAVRSPVQSSFASRFQLATPRLTPAEIPILGGTYGDAYGLPSGTIHFGNQQFQPMGPDVEIAELVRIVVLALHLVLRVHVLLGEPDSPPVATAGHLLAGLTAAPELFDKTFVKAVITMGDIVLVRGFLGEVVDVHTSNVGYRSFLIRFLAERPMPDLEEDWCAARSLSLLFKTSKVRSGAVAILREHGVPVAEDADHQVELRAAVLDAWNRGLREDARRRLA
jgi:hypothetical protein